MRWNQINFQSTSFCQFYCAY